MTDTIDTPPEVAGSVPQNEDPTVKGKLTDAESQALAQLRRQGQQTQMQIGEMEIHKARLLGNMADLEAQAQRIMTEAGKRLGIPDGTPWNVTPDGTVRIVPGGRPNMG